LPDKSKKEAKDQTLTEILNCLLDELKGSQVKQLKTILSSDDNEEKKKRKVKDILQSLGESGAAEVLSNILLHREIQTVLLK